jgi:membrane-associated phospholipid phosphatase
MEANQASLNRLNRLIWTGIALVAAVVLAACLFGRFQLGWMSFTKSGAVCALLVVGGWYYGALRKEPQLSAALTGTSQVIAFALVGAPLSYIAASADLPLWDTTFVAWDEYLGFDWMALLRLMNEHPAAHLVFAVSYASFPLQATAIIVALTWSKDFTRLRVFILAFMLTTIVTIAISAVMPAQGVWGHLHLSKTDYPAIAPITQSLHIPIFHGLRDGTLRILAGEGAEGIITFPSLHAALGLLFIVAAWPVPFVRWAAVSVNTAMIAATPVDGGHYFSDVIAGLAIALACWLAIARFAAGQPSERMSTVIGGTVAAARAQSFVPASNAAPSCETARRVRASEHA